MRRRLSLVVVSWQVAQPTCRPGVELVPEPLLTVRAMLTASSNEMFYCGVVVARE